VLLRTKKEIEPLGCEGIRWTAADPVRRSSDATYQAHVHGFCFLKYISHAIAKGRTALVAGSEADRRTCQKAIPQLVSFGECT
jgi:hypothetical protein